MTANTQVTVAIPARDRSPGLCAVVADLMAGDRRPDEILVICQGPAAVESAHRLKREVPAAVPTLRFYASTRRGVNASRNDAVRLAKGSFIAFSDDDMRLPATWLNTMLDTWERAWRLAPVLLTGPILAPEGTADAGLTPGRRQLDTRHVWRVPPVSGDVLHGGHFGAPRSAYTKAGSPPFDERLGPGTRFPGAGDEEFALRLLSTGVPVAYEPAIHAVHVANPDEWIRSQFHHSRGSGALFLLRRSRGDAAVRQALARTVGGLAAKGTRAAVQLRFREAAGNVAALSGMTVGWGHWWITASGTRPRASEPTSTELRLVPLD